MKMKSLVVAICVIGIALLTGQAFADFTGGKLKLDSVVVDSSGVQFTIKSGKPVGEPTCNNEFFVDPLNPDYNLMSAFLLAASAQKKKIDFDADADCEVTAVKVY